jgi:hypothetical protein
LVAAAWNHRAAAIVLPSRIVFRKIDAMRILPTVAAPLLFAAIASLALAEPPKAPAPAPAPVAPPAPAPAAPARDKLTCAAYRDRQAERYKQAAFDTRLKAGSWGRLPPELRKLPPRAKLCGADSHGQAVVASPLVGKDLESFYRPLFAKLGFDQLTCTGTGGQTTCKCKRRRDIGIVVTDSTSEAYVVSMVVRARTPAQLMARGHDR